MGQMQKIKALYYIKYTLSNYDINVGLFIFDLTHIRDYGRNSSKNFIFIIAKRNCFWN